jgi:endonuclease/exonuclease/phosphatase family metal-dependent hydrolase
LASPRLRIIPALIASLIVLLCWAGAVFVFQPFGQRGWASAPIAALLMGLASTIRPTPPGDLDRPRRRSLRIARTVLMVALVCWLGLIGWSSMSPGGVMPAVKAHAAIVRVVTWNILHGGERGTPWSRYGWSVRKVALRSALEAARPDILCVQEALVEQVEAVAAMLPGHHRVGVGRDDGRTSGEHCAIYFDPNRFEELGGGTFWLEDPTDAPPTSTLLGPKRICTWVRLRDRHRGRCLRVYNVHAYLTESARVRSTRRILDRIASGDPTDAVLVAGDFNATPEDSDRRLFDESGLIASGKLAGESIATPTYQFYGIRLRSLDDILINQGWRVVQHRVLDVKPGNTFPSDHFGVMADLELREDASSSVLILRWQGRFARSRLRARRAHT